MKNVNSVLINNVDVEHLINEIVNKVTNVISTTTTTQKNEDEYMTRTQTIELLKINSCTLWRWTKQGVIPCYGIENRTYYKRSDIINAMQRIN